MARILLQNLAEVRGTDRHRQPIQRVADGLRLQTVSACNWRTCTGYCWGQSCRPRSGPNCSFAHRNRIGTQQRAISPASTLARPWGFVDEPSECGRGRAPSIRITSSAFQRCECGNQASPLQDGGANCCDCLEAPAGRCEALASKACAVVFVPLSEERKSTHHLLTLPSNSRSALRVGQGTLACPSERSLGPAEWPDRTTKRRAAVDVNEGESLANTVGRTKPYPRSIMNQQWFSEGNLV